MRLGWIGCGNMGNLMVERLMVAGHELHIHTRTPARAAPLLARGASWCTTPREVRERTEVVFSMVGGPVTVREVYLGAAGVLSAAAGASVCVDMTTSAPELARELHTAGAAVGVTTLDAPVSGGVRGAAGGSLAIMVGGPQHGFEAALPLLGALGHQIQHMGGPGAGQNTKLGNQIALAGTLLGACEAICFARARGLDLHQMLGVLSRGAAGSWVLEHLGILMARGDRSQGFRLDHFLKDLDLALGVAPARPLPATALARELAHRLVQLGYGDAGFQSLIHAYPASPASRPQDGQCVNESLTPSESLDEEYHDSQQ